MVAYLYVISDQPIDSILVNGVELLNGSTPQTTPGVLQYNQGLPASRPDQVFSGRTIAATRYSDDNCHIGNCAITAPTFAGASSLSVPLVNCAYDIAITSGDKTVNCFRRVCLGGNIEVTDLVWDGLNDPLTCQRTNVPGFPSDWVFDYEYQYSMPGFTLPDITFNPCGGGPAVVADIGPWSATIRYRNTVTEGNGTTSFLQTTNTYTGRLVYGWDAYGGDTSLYRCRPPVIYIAFIGEVTSATTDGTFNAVTTVEYDNLYIGGISLPNCFMSISGGAFFIDERLGVCSSLFPGDCFCVQYATSIGTALFNC